MILRDKEDIIFSLTGDEGIIDHSVRYVTRIFASCHDFNLSKEDMLIAYNFILANALLMGTNITRFNGLIFQSIYHVDEYILQHDNPIPLMILLIRMVGRY